VVLLFGAESFCESSCFFISNTRELRDSLLLVLLLSFWDVGSISVNVFTEVSLSEKETS
jgi:hypothetical protein